jgi:hypothetical protein
MNFTVTWKPTAVNKLAELWEEAVNRAAVSDAANSIDSLLSKSPTEVGESREENTRFLYVAPLAIYFDVFPQDRKVSVWAVWKRKESK